MYDYSAEMNEMIVFTITLFLLDYKNIFDCFGFLFEQFVSILFTACMNVVKWLFIDKYDYSAEMIEMIVFMVALFLVGYKNDLIVLFFI